MMQQRSMKHVIGEIEKMGAAYSGHRIFERLRDRDGDEDFLARVGMLAFWVLAFQDVLQFNTPLVQGRELRKVALHHKAEDSGHDRWFLDDLAKLGLPASDADMLFSKQNAAVRAATYKIMGEVFSPLSDEERITLILALEACGHAFFGAVAAYTGARDDLPPLKYLSSFHLDCEKDHELFEAQLQAMLAERVIEDATEAACLRLARKVTSALTDMLDAIEDAITAATGAETAAVAA